MRMCGWTFYAYNLYMQGFVPKFVWQSAILSCKSLSFSNFIIRYFVTEPK